HRDLKPQNILLDDDGVVRLLDFGLASRVDRSVAISRGGGLVGTLAYMSPEQCRGEEATPASDLYALGCMMFELLTGTLPFPSGMATIQARLKGPVPHVDERVHGVPAAIADICYRLMARDPADRPTIVQVREALGIGSSGSESDSVTSEERSRDRLSERWGGSGQPFVGRRDELETLSGCLDRALAGQIELALIVGASGIGKSALAAMVSKRARRDRFLCVRGRCYERERMPLVAFDRAVDALILNLARWPRERLKPLSPLFLPLCRLFPAFALLEPELKNRSLVTVASDLRELHQRSFDAFCALLNQLQEQVPILLVLDDLQWVNEESIALLLAVLGRVSGRVLILGTYRPESIGADHPLSRLLRQLDRANDSSPLGRATQIQLGALRRDEAMALVDAVAGQRLDPATAAALAERASGNPFLTLQMTDYVSGNVGEAGLDSEVRTARLKIDADGLLRERIAALSKWAGQLLSLAAAAGGDMAESVLIVAAQRLGLSGADDFAQALDELISQRLCRVESSPVDSVSSEQSADSAAGEASSLSIGRDETRIDLCHDRIRDVAYARLEPELRMAVHRALAEALEADGGGAGMRGQEQALMRHWGMAGEEGKRRHYALAAAERAIEQVAFHHAEKLLRSTFTDSEPGVPPEILAVRWEQIGELCEYTGRPKAAGEAYGRALALWEDSVADTAENRPTLLRLYGRVGETLCTSGNIAGGRRVYKLGLDLLKLSDGRSRLGRVAVLGWLLCRLALAPLTRLLPSRRTDTRFIKEQVRFLESSGRLALSIWPESAAEIMLRCELLARRIADTRVVHRSTMMRAMLAYAMHPMSPRLLNRIRRRLDAAELTAREHNVPLGIELVQMYRALLWTSFDTVRARRLNESARAGLARRGMLGFSDGAMARAGYVGLLVQGGEYDDALAVIAGELQGQRFLSKLYALVFKIRILNDRGQREQARTTLAQLEELLYDKPPSGLDLLLELSRCSVAVVHGRFAEALTMAAQFDRTRQSTLGLNGLKALWVEVIANAIEGLVRSRQLTDHPHERWARRRMRWLARRGALGTKAVGLRVLAIIAHGDGKQRAAQRALRRALDESAINANPYRRWLCLEAVRYLGVMTAEYETEASDLVARYALVLPDGW
ncbi:MAG: AAA family ATPase, partial [Myxococcota bacterium]